MDASPADPGAFWDEIYRPASYRYGTRPNAFLVEQSYRLPPRSRILCVGDGEGRNGVWLAGQGHKVVSVDVSPRALQKASRLALEKGVFLSTICADLADWEWPEEEYDAVVSIYLHLPPGHRAVVHRRMATALKRGGQIILEAFGPEQAGRSSGGPPSPEMLYTDEMLCSDFPSLDVVLCEAVEADLDEGEGHRGRASVVRFVAYSPTGQ